jgi:hypothetical protein
MCVLIFNRKEQTGDIRAGNPLSEHQTESFCFHLSSIAFLASFFSIFGLFCLIRSVLLLEK